MKLLRNFHLFLIVGIILHYIELPATGQTYSADIGIKNLIVSPTVLSAGLAPGQVTLIITNGGPDALPLNASDLLLNYYLSPTLNPLDPGSRLLAQVDLSIGTDIPVNGEVEIDYADVPLDLSDFAIPATAKGTNYLIIIDIPNTLEGVSDPNYPNNGLASIPLVINPITSSQYMVFSQETPMASNAVLVASNDVGFNYDYGNSWVFNGLDSSFTCQISASNSGSARLHVRHLTSLSGGCAGQGYSPVNIYCNGAALARNYDPAQHHAGVHTYVDDYWPIYLNAGPNTFQWTAGSLCSLYWIQMLEILPTAPLNITSITLGPPKVVTFRVTGTSTNVGWLESSTNLINWTMALSVPAFTNNCTVSITNSMTLGRQFFRLNFPN